MTPKAIALAVIMLACLLPYSTMHAGDKTCVEPKPAQDDKFQPGQVWQYKTRPGEERSFITILRVESLPKGTIIHIRVDQIRLRNCSGGPEPEQLEHMPFARDAIERSVTKLVKKNVEIPEFKEGYDDWRKACGGVYAITVSEAIKVAEMTLNQNLGCESKTPSN